MIDRVLIVADGKPYRESDPLGYFRIGDVVRLDRGNYGIHDIKDVAPGVRVMWLYPTELDGERTIKGGNNLSERVKRAIQEGKIDLGHLVDQEEQHRKALNGGFKPGPLYDY